jgi:hypothetical protein
MNLDLFYIMVLLPSSAEGFLNPGGHVTGEPELAWGRSRTGRDPVS